jgi:hypothetical protein
MTHANDSTTPAVPDFGASYARRLLHRWLIEYNPLYLLSAALVLAGTFLCSRGLADEESFFGPLGVAAVAEVYAVCLIGGAALLMRIGQRRPAVMLAMLTVLYQWDLTLHTERTPYFGTWAAAVWVLVFAGKLHALAWAMKLRLSRGAAGTAILAGLGLAAFPLHLHHLEPRQAGSLIAVWVFALASLHGSATVTSLASLEAWGATVLQRAVRAAAVVSALLIAGHVLLWSWQQDIFLAALVPVAPLVLVRRVRGEARVWALVLGTLAFVGAAMPAAFSVTALLAAAALALRALSPSLPMEHQRVQVATRPVPPYRASVLDAPPEEAEVVTSVVATPLDPDAQKRLLAGAIFAAYLSAWTLGWSGGSWPAHLAALDVLLTAAVIAAAWRARLRVALAPLLGTYVHFVAQAGLMPVPRSLVEWGASAVGLGFALLVGSLATSYRLRTPATEGTPSGGP